MFSQVHIWWASGGAPKVGGDERGVELQGVHCYHSQRTRQSEVLNLNLSSKHHWNYKGSNGLRSKQIILLSFPPPKYPIATELKRNYTDTISGLFFPASGSPNKKYPPNKTPNFPTWDHDDKHCANGGMSFASIFVGRQNANLRRFLLSNVRNTLSHSIVLIGWSQYDNPCVHGL